MVQRSTAWGDVYVSDRSGVLMQTGAHWRIVTPSLESRGEQETKEWEIDTTGSSWVCMPGSIGKVEMQKS